MAVLTSQDDDSVGATLPASTHNPTNLSGAIYIDTGSSDLAISYCRFSYAGTGLKGRNFTNVRHCQFVRCATGIDFHHGDQGGLYNVLFAKCAIALLTAGITLTGQQITADGTGITGAVFDSDPSDTGTLVNSILTACPLSGAFTLTSSVTNSAPLVSIRAPAVAIITWPRSVPTAMPGPRTSPCWQT